MSYEVVGVGEDDEEGDEADDKDEAFAELKRAPPWTTYPDVGKEDKVYRKSEGHYDTHVACLFSLFEWHTETLNAWTILAHGALQVSVFFYFLFSRELRGVDLALFLTHAIVIATHAIFATGYHLFMPVSLETHLEWRRLDGFGAYASFTSTGFLLSYYAFPPSVFYCLLGLSLLVQTFAYAEMIFSWTARTYHDEYRHTVWYKMAVAAIPQTAALAYGGVSDVVERGSATLLIVAAATVLLQVMGTESYRRGFPERMTRGYDFPASHVLMHVCILGCDALILFFAVTLRDRIRR